MLPRAFQLAHTHTHTHLYGLPTKVLDVGRHYFFWALSLSGAVSSAKHLHETIHSARSVPNLG